MSEAIVSLVVAVGRNGVIGGDGDMPWRQSSDLRRFKALTLGKALVMGRRTFDSIGRALPGRHTVVLTRKPDWSAPRVEVRHDLAGAVEAARGWSARNGAGEIVIAGGGEIYRLAMPHVALARVTTVEAEPEGDTRFDTSALAGWTRLSALHTPAGPRDDHATTYAVYART